MTSVPLTTLLLTMATLVLLTRICHERFAFGVSEFAFAMSKFAFAVSNLLLPGQLWATVTFAVSEFAFAVSDLLFP